MDRKYWNSRLKHMQGYTYGLQPEMTPDTVKLNTNECPYPPSPRALEAIRAAAPERLALSRASGMTAERDQRGYAMPREKHLLQRQ
jgi:histidinol-phosphate aminotransferase